MTLDIQHRQEFSNFHPHAEIIVDKIIPLITVLPTAGVFVAVTGWGLSRSSVDSRIDVNIVTGDITVDERGFGVYQIQNNCSFFSSKANVVATASIFLNGVRRPNLSWTESIQTPNEIANVGFSQILQVDTGDVISFRMATDANNVTISLVDGALSAYWLSGE